MLDRQPGGLQLDIHQWGLGCIDVFSRAGVKGDAPGPSGVVVWCSLGMCVALNKPLCRVGQGFDCRRELLQREEGRGISSVWAQNQAPAAVCCPGCLLGGRRQRRQDWGSCTALCGLQRGVGPCMWLHAAAVAPAADGAGTVVPCTYWWEPLRGAAVRSPAAQAGWVRSSCCYTVCCGMYEPFTIPLGASAGAVRGRGVSCCCLLPPPCNMIIINPTGPDEVFA